MRIFKIPSSSCLATGKAVTCTVLRNAAACLPSAKASELFCFITLFKSVWLTYFKKLNKAKSLGGPVSGPGLNCERDKISLGGGGRDYKGLLLQTFETTWPKYAVCFKTTILNFAITTLVYCCG